MKKKMVKVRMLVSTAYQGPRKEGDELLVPEDFANRWVKNGIAEFVEKEGDDENENENDVAGQEEAPVNDNAEPQEGDEGEEDSEEKAPVVDESNYDALTAKELYEICKEQGLDVEARKSKAYYIEKLEEEAAGTTTEE